MRALQRVLLATDGSQDARLAARAAVDLTQRLGAELHVVTVYTPSHVYSYRYAFTADDSEFYREDAQRLLDREVERLAGLGTGMVKAHLREGLPATEILAVAEENDVDLLVMGSRGHGLLDRLITGSVSEDVVHHAHRPVLLVRGGEQAWPPSAMVIGEDFSEHAAGAASIAARIGGLYGSRALLLSAYPEPAGGIEEAAGAVAEALEQAEQDLQDRASELEEVLGSRPEWRLVSGDAATRIVDAADESGEATLVAVGSRGLSALQRMRLGSVSTKVLRAAQHPVLIVPAGSQV